MNVIKNIEQYFEIVILNSTGNFATNLSVAYEIRKDIDDSIITNGTASEINNVYYFKYTFSDIGSYRLKYTTPDGYENGFDQIIVTEDNFSNINNGLTIINDNIINVSDQLELHRQETELRIKYILGLSQQNFKIFDQVYNLDNLLLSSTIRIYDNSSDCNNDSNMLKEYSMSATYDINGRITSYKVIEV